MLVARLRSVPLSVVMLGLGGLGMTMPAIHAAVREDWAVARAFVHSGLAVLMLFLAIAIAAQGNAQDRSPRSYLAALALAFTLLPAAFALPLVLLLDVTLFDAWFEMVSSFTTTGATLLPPVPEIPPSVHLWRAEVGWLGGFLAWVMAAAIFAPLNLGGYEVTSGTQVGRAVPAGTPSIRAADPGDRLIRFSTGLFPIYVGLTAALWLLLILAGASPFVALCHAMSTISTSGISPVGGLAAGGAGIPGEIAIAAFLVFALSRATFRRDERPNGLRGLRRDPELGMAGSILLCVVVLLFLRHFLDPRAGLWDAGDALRGLWGTFFTALSFLTTTGFEGSTWRVAQIWSGLETPALLLMGLAIVGGGVATAAGGVRLLRIYALYTHGLREMDRLVHPNAVGGRGDEGRHIRGRGAYVAWIFFMLFAIAVAVTAAALTLAGQDFHHAMILTVAALSTTGSLAAMSGEASQGYAGLGTDAKAVLAAAMVVGRVELLALIALANPGAWRG